MRPDQLEQAAIAFGVVAAAAAQGNRDRQLGRRGKGEGELVLEIAERAIELGIQRRPPQLGGSRHVGEAPRAPVAGPQVALQQGVFSGVTLPGRARPLGQFGRDDVQPNLGALLDLVVRDVIGGNEAVDPGQQDRAKFGEVLSVVGLPDEVEDRAQVTFAQRRHQARVRVYA